MLLVSVCVCVCVCVCVHACVHVCVWLCELKMVCLIGNVSSRETIVHKVEEIFTVLNRLTDTRSHLNQFR